MTGAANLASIKARAEPLPGEFTPSRLSRSLALLTAALLVVIALVVMVPGLDSVRRILSGAKPGWLLLGVLLELLSCLSYVVVFRAVFCERMSWRTSAEIGLSEQAANSLLSVGGLGGLALGAWILRRGGIPAAQIARRTVAFFLLTSLANVSFLVIGGIALLGGLATGPSNLLLGLVPAVVGVAAIALTLVTGGIARSLGRRSRNPKIRVGLGVVGDGVTEAVALLRRREPAVAGGSAGYMLFDLATLAVCFPAFGIAMPPLDVLLLAYIIGQLGGLVPLPGGIGGLDGGLIGALVLYGVHATDAAVAVLAYRGLLLAVPSAVGLPALAMLRKRLRREQHDIGACAPGEEVEIIGHGRVRTAASPVV